MKLNLENDRLNMAAAIAACKRYKIIVKFNYEITKKTQNQFLKPNEHGGPEINFGSQNLMSDLKKSQESTEKRQLEAARVLSSEMINFKKNLVEEF